MPLSLSPDIFRSVLEDLPIGAYFVDRSRRIVFWNASAERITGYLGQEVIGRFCHENILMHCNADQELLCGAACPMAHTMMDGRPRDTDVFLRHKDGQRIPVRVRAMPIRNEAGSIIGSAEFFQEPSSRATETRGRRTSIEESLDEMTQLPDQAALVAAIEQALQRFGETQKAFGVLVIGVDDLEHLRRFDGVQAVRDILYAAAQTFAQSLRSTDMVGCWPTHRFAVLSACPAMEGLEESARRVQRLVSLAAVPWWGDRLSITVSVGGAMVRAGDTVETLMGRVERALEDGMSKQGQVIVMVQGK